MSSPAPGSAAGCKERLENGGEVEGRVVTGMKQAKKDNSGLLHP